MSPLLNQAFGLEIAAMRQAQFEAEARHGALVRMLKRARRADHALTARTAARPAEHRVGAPTSRPVFVSAIQSAAASWANSRRIVAAEAPRRAHASSTPSSSSPPRRNSRIWRWRWRRFIADDANSCCTRTGNQSKFNHFSIIIESPRMTPYRFVNYLWDDAKAARNWRATRSASPTRYPT